MTATRETVPDRWTELDETFFTLVGDVLTTRFLWGAATLLASYDDEQPTTVLPPHSARPRAGVPTQRSLAA